MEIERRDRDDCKETETLDRSSCPLPPLTTLIENWSQAKLLMIGTRLSNAFQALHLDKMAIRDLLSALPMPARLSICGRFLLFYIQRPILSTSQLYTERLMLLLECCPLSSTFSDREGNIAMHYYCGIASSGLSNYDTSSTILNALLECHPQSPSLYNAHGRTPLHIHLEDDHPRPHVIRRLLQVCPGAARLPLKTISHDTTQAQGTDLNSNVNGNVNEPNVETRYPLHCLFSVRSASLDEECARILISQFPEAAAIQTREKVIKLLMNGERLVVDHSWTPYERAIQGKYSSVVTLIEKEWERLAMQRIFCFMNRTHITPQQVVHTNMI